MRPSTFKKFSNLLVLVPDPSGLVTCQVVAGDMAFTGPYSSEPIWKCLVHHITVALARMTAKRRVSQLDAVMTSFCPHRMLCLYYP